MSDASPGWRSGLLVSNKNVPIGSAGAGISNASLVLSHDEAWAGVLAYDAFAETIVTTKPAPWRKADAPTETKAGDWSDEDTARTQSWLAGAYGLNVSEGVALASVKLAAHRNRIHPIVDWLETLRWDAVKRAPTWLVDVMGAEDTPYVRAVGQAFLVACVARVMRPGCKVDTVPILEGDQGIGKSSTIRALVGDAFFLEMSVTDLANKDSMQVLRRKWVAEMPEIDGLNRTETSHIKGFFSRQVDTYRASYGKGAKDYPRQTCFVGTTNAEEYLKDETGGRRFWPVRCSRGSPQKATALREQLWAEAYARFTSAEEWHVTDPELLDEFARQQDARYRSDPIESLVSQWLHGKVQLGPPRWEGGVTTSDVLGGALGLEPGKWTQADANRVAAVLRRLGWRQGKQERRSGARIRPFRPVHPEQYTNGAGSGVVVALPPEDQVDASLFDERDPYDVAEESH